MEWEWVGEKWGWGARQQESNLTPNSNKERSSTSAPTHTPINTFIKGVPNFKYKFND
jgi:hypothetical protein